MSQLVLDIKDVKRNTQILQQLLGAELECSPDGRCLVASTSNNVTTITEVKDNNTSQLSHPNELFYVNLDPYAEHIIQMLSDEIFVQFFHFDKVMVRCLLMELHQRTYYDPSHDANEKISFDMSVLVTLTYLHHGHLEYLAVLEYFNYCSADVLKKCIKRVCQTIVHFLSTVYIKFPCSEKEQRSIRSEFLRQYGVPGVLGVLECYYVMLQSVPDHEMHMYVGRHCPQPSIAVQVICDQNYRFLDVNARFSGNTFNTYLWKHSHIRHIMQHSQKEIEPMTWLIADRGYRLTSEVINPYRNAVNIQQESVNTALMEVHRVIDKSFGLLTARFGCLKTNLPFSHKHASNVVTACATLHNYLLAKNRPVDDLPVPPAIKNNLPNAYNEDVFAPIGLSNRNFIKDFIFNNSLQILYRMRKASNISFISDDDTYISVDH